MLRPTAVWNSHQFNCWEKCWAAGCLVRRSAGKARVETRRLSVLSEPQQDQTKAENLQVLETLWYFLRSCGESCEKFCEEIANGTLKNERRSHLESKSRSCVIRQRHSVCPLWRLSFSLMLGWETIPHMKDESLRSFLPFFCVSPKALG